MRRRLIDFWAVANGLASIALLLYPAGAVWAAAIWVDGADHLVGPQVLTWFTALLLVFASWGLWSDADLDATRDEIVKESRR